jgi:hypothetical protein
MLAGWLVEREVEEVVMASTAQYWRPVCSSRTGGRSAGPARTPRACRARCISPRRNRIGAPVVAEGETDPAALAALAAPRLRATAEQLCDAFQSCPTLHPVDRRLLQLTLEKLRVIEDHLGQLDQQMADLLAAHHDAVQRFAEVPGLGVDSAQQIIADVVATAATLRFPHRRISRPGWAPVPATRRVPA